MSKQDNIGDFVVGAFIGAGGAFVGAVAGAGAVVGTVAGAGAAFVAVASTAEHFNSVKYNTIAFVSGIFTGLAGISYFVAHIASTEPTNAPATPTVTPAPCTAPASEFQKTRFSNHDKAIQKIAFEYGLKMPKAPAAS